MNTLSTLRSLGTAAALLALLIGAGCKNSSTSPALEDGADRQGATADAETLGDREILGALAAIDTGEITQGTLARTQATDATVRAYGESMVTMHTQASARLTALSQRIDMTPQDSARSRALASDATSTHQRLSGMSGAAFDRAYIDAQVMQHTHALDLIDHTLLPQAHNQELRAALTNDVRPMVDAHLQQARGIADRIDVAAPPPEGTNGQRPITR